MSSHLAQGRIQIKAGQSERWAGNVFIMPAVLVVLLLSVFPLVISLYMSLARLKFVPGGFEIGFVGLANYRKLFFGSEQARFLGALASPSLLGWLILGVVVALMIFGLVSYMRSPRFRLMGLFWRGVAAVAGSLLVWLLVETINSGGRAGTLATTFFYVFVGIFVQYVIGLGLALLTTQQLPGRRFFRVIYLLPMMITPVGVAYMFRMMTDTGKGPFTPLWQGLGLANFSWINDPWSARTAILIADAWQWTPFMFIVLLAALEGQSVETVEASLVDGANRWQIFRYIIWPGILPVSLTVILIRMIEAFKIIDLPNVMTNGGPGTATQSLTFQAFTLWRTLDLGGSAAVAYTLLFVVTFIATVYVNMIRRRFTEA
ncbi:MAG: ABC transporter permease subunit [Chloroflexi bacterium]|nr:ABC transporter permease subunit [Chloroflexota bacterium]